MVAEQINAHLTESAGFLCDRCIREALALRHLTQVQQVTGALATTSEFVREKGVCGRCRKGKLVTRRVT